MNISRHLYAIGGIMAILTAGSYGTARLKTAPYAPAASNVFVTNTTANPVPTAAQGTTQVAGNVGLVAGTKVGVNGTVLLNPESQVQVNNSAAGPLMVRDATPRTPLTIHKGANIPDGETSTGTQLIYQVPQDKMLVIQQIFGTETNPAGEHVIMSDIDTDNGSNDPHFFPVQFVNEGTNYYERGNAMAQTTIYVEPGSVLNIFALRNGSTGTTMVTIGFSGYLVDAP